MKFDRKAVLDMVGKATRGRTATAGMIGVGAAAAAYGLCVDPETVSAMMGYAYHAAISNFPWMAADKAAQAWFAGASALLSGSAQAVAHLVDPGVVSSVLSSLHDAVGAGMGSLRAVPGALSDAVRAGHDLVSRAFAFASDPVNLAKGILAWQVIEKVAQVLDAASVIRDAAATAARKARSLLARFGIGRGPSAAPAPSAAASVTAAPAAQPLAASPAVVNMTINLQAGDDQALSRVLAALREHAPGLVTIGAEAKAVAAAADSALPGDPGEGRTAMIAEAIVRSAAAAAADAEAAGRILPDGDEDRVEAALMSDAAPRGGRRVNVSVAKRLIDEAVMVSEASGLGVSELLALSLKRAAAENGLVTSGRGVSRETPADPKIHAATRSRFDEITSFYGDDREPARRDRAGELVTVPARGGDDGFSP